MPLNLVVPSVMRREKSDSCIRPKDNTPTSSKMSQSEQHDHNLLDVLWKNYELVAALADIEEEHMPRSSSRYCRLDSSLENNDFRQGKVIEEPISHSFDSVTSTASAIEESSRSTLLKNHLRDFYRDVIDAFYAPTKLPSEIQNSDHTKLSAFVLRRDLKRCFSALHPLLEVGAALQDIVFWKSPIFTLLFAIVFFYSIVRGLTASLVLLLLLLQLTLNYLHTCRNIDLGLCFLPRRKVPVPHFDMSGAQIIFDIAKTVQSLLKVAADISEKFNNLLIWRNPEVTSVFYGLVVYWLLLSLLFNTGTCLGMCAFTLGIRIFVTTYLFDRFPRLRYRLDTYGFFYRNLPIGVVKEEVEHHSPKAITKSRTSPKLIVRPPSSSVETRSLGGMGSSMSASLESLAGSVSLPSQSSEEEDNGIMLLRDTVITSRGCILYERNQHFPKNITSGTLYLTDNSLAFRAKKSTTHDFPSVILFHDIISVKKIMTLRTVGLIAGSRKAIEVRLVNRRRSIQFLGISGREDFMARMRQECAKQQAATHFVVDDNEEAD